MTKKTENTKHRITGDPLEYHRRNRPGKFEIQATKPLSTQNDLSLAYSPGVADVCLAIAENPNDVWQYTAKANTVAVITNGTAVLGLGDIGAMAAKPVMEGKAVLFKKFADIDGINIEVDEKDPDMFIETVARIASTFGGINLEDIKGPECFKIEQELIKRCDVPIMHDDQHGTAIVLVAALMNALELTGKKKEKIRVVCSGAGAAGISCMKMLIAYGVKPENIMMLDRAGVIYEGRDQMNEYIAEFAVKTKARTLDDAMADADVFVGLSAAGVLKKKTVAKMAKDPIIFALANPDPEIWPEDVYEVRDDAIVATGRSDYPNQVNNALCYPYIFRGALDVGATKINMEMKMAAAEALSNLAKEDQDAALETAYKGGAVHFGPEYIIPKPFDPRLIYTVAPAVAKAAMKTGVATRPIMDLAGYAVSLKARTDHSFSMMHRIHETAQQAPKRVAFPEGYDPRVIRAAQILVNEKIAHPILIGRAEEIRKEISARKLKMVEGEDFTLVDPSDYEKIDDYAQAYYDIRKREGLLPPEAEIVMRYRWAATAAMMMRKGDADAMVTGLTGRFDKFLRQARQIIGPTFFEGNMYALHMLMLKNGVLFIGDTNVNVDPTAEQLAELTLLAAEEVKHFGIEPRVAMVSHSHFGSSFAASAIKMRQALAMVRHRDPSLLIEGEMTADAALDPNIMEKTFPHSVLKEPANVLIMPSMDAANIAFNLLKVDSGAEVLGPILLGVKQPVHIMSVYATVSQIVNITSLAVVEAQAREHHEPKKTKR